MARAELEAFITAKGITMAVEFVPWSRSRNKGEKAPSLNWRVTILREGREVLSTDYGAGIAHCPSYQQRATVDSDAAVKRECEMGKRQLYLAGAGVFSPREAILPDLCDVLASLALDSAVIDYGRFEDWARDLGYDPDSRRAEAIYRACLETALRLRAGLGETGLGELREAAQDY
jgi:hypothetical protein